MRIFFVLWIFSLFLFTETLNQQCSEISTSFSNEIFGDAGALSAALTFSVKYENYTNILTIKNMTFQSNLTVPFNLPVCIQSFTTVLNECYNFSQPFDISLNNESFVLSVSVNPTDSAWGYPIFLFLGFVDSGNLVSYNGTFFSDENKCISYKNQDIYVLNFLYYWINIPKLVETCCSSLKQIPPAVSNAPKCQSFHLTSKITPLNDDPVSSSSADFIIDDNSIKAKGVYSDSTYIFGINNLPCQTGLSSNTQYCEYFFDTDETEFMITYIHDMFLGMWSYSVLGKIILRNNQTFMEDGIPFTESMNCTFSNYTDTYDFINIENQLCCTDFGASVSTPPPISPESDFQGCDKINSFVTRLMDDGSRINISADFEIVNSVNVINNIKISNFVSDTPLNFGNTSVTICNNQFINFEQYVCYPNSTMISLGNEMFNFYSPWSLIYDDGTPYTYFAYLSMGIVDDGNFVGSDGLLYDDNNKCSSFQFNDQITTQIGNEAIFPDYNFNITTCCTSLKSIKAPSKLPACIRFSVLSTAYNTTNNNVHQTYSAEFTLFDTDFWGIGDFIGPYFPVFGINDFHFQVGNNLKQYGSFPISKKGSEILIYLNWDYYNSVTVGRIILRDGQTFMDIKGAIPFFGNDCKNFTQYLPKYQVNVISKFCCTAYDSSTTTSLPTDSTTTSSNSSLSSPNTSASSSLSPNTSTSISTMTTSTLQPTTSSTCSTYAVSIKLLNICIAVYCLFTIFY